MSRPGRRAALPEPATGHARRPPLDASGLIVTHVDEQGTGRRVYDCSLLPVGEQVQRDLAAILARKVGPVGPWRSLETGTGQWWAIRRFAAFLSTLTPPLRSLSVLTPGQWAAWKLSLPAARTATDQTATIARLLLHHPGLPGPTREALQVRYRLPPTREEAYRVEEFEAIVRSARRSFRSAVGRIAQNRAHLARWRSGRYTPGADDWLLGEALDVLARTGDVPGHRSTKQHRIVTNRYRRVLGGTSAAATWRRLFLDGPEAVSLAVLLIASFGWNATSVYELTVPAPLPETGGDNALMYRVELEKRRRRRPHRYETCNLTDWGAASPGRLITEAIEATTPAREALRGLGEPTDRLLAWHANTGMRPVDPASIFRTGSISDLIRRWESDHRQRVSLRRLRKTTVAQQHRRPVQHSQDVHDRVYVLPDRQTQERAAAVIAAGIDQAARRSRSALIARIGTGHEAGAETATARCTDHTHSPFSPAGSPCRASFLSCLACPNAVIAPQHLPRLAYLHRALDGLRSVLEPGVWEQDWREAFERLEDLRQGHSTEAEWGDALASVRAADRRVIDRLLDGGYDA